MSGVVLRLVSAALRHRGLDDSVAAFLYNNEKWIVEADGSRCIYVSLGEVEGIYTACSWSLTLASIKLLFRVLAGYEAK